MSEVQSDKRKLAGQATRERLLAAAEQLFASRGFDGTSTRALVEEAGVDIAMIVYHFGSKLGLYREILLRRAERVNEVRLAELDAVLGAREQGTPDLAAVVRALVGTNIRLRTDPSLGGLPVARLFARELIDPDQAGRHTIAEMFGKAAQRFIAAIGLALPHASQESIYWAYHFAISAMVQTMANVSTLEDLSGGVCDMSDSERVIDHLVPFVVEGIKGCVAAHDAGAGKKFAPSRGVKLASRQPKPARASAGKAAPALGKRGDGKA